MEKKRILFIVEAMGGGLFTYIVDLANELAGAYDMTVAYALRPQTPENFRSYFDPAVRLIEVESFTRSIDPGKDLRALFEIRRIAREVRPDVIHLHSSKAGALGRIAFSGKDVPLFYTPHGYSFLMENYDSTKLRAFRGIEAALAKRNCTTISCSPGEHAETLKLTSNAAYVDNGINTRALDALIARSERTAQPFTVFTLGRICRQKNPAMFNAVAEIMPETRFLWIGDGELRDELKSGNIEVTGWVSREEALRRAVNADVFMLPSLWEGLPISLLEAMYLQKLCVVSDVIGNHDVIRNGENGFVCRTAEEFKAAILTPSPERLTAAAYNDILTHYNTTEMGRQYAALYERAMAQRGA